MNRAGRSERPSPDEFLSLIEKSRRGRLKVYVGHAAGVGKTFQMLEDAQLLRARGVDVVAGLIETHGRAETAARAEGLPAIPRRRIEYKGRIFEEMDLGAILDRRPELVLVDELAHTNVEGAENEKRYQDVDQILAAGISVMTTVNIQHFESLQDTVSRVTGVAVRERVPDRLLRQADAIVNVDLPSGELIQRLKEGKIYPLEQVPAALANFFREESLASLRELALRSIADRLEAERQSRERGGESEVVGDKVLVAMSSNPETTRRLLRRASTLAGRLNMNWFAVYVRTPTEDPKLLAARDHRRLAENVTLAMELGAKVVCLEGRDVAEELSRFAREQGVSTVLFGKSHRSRWWRLFRPSPIDRFGRIGSGLDVVEIETSGNAPLARG
jgi:two-component system sensor histidine kinase KdpD